jgi:hypothetical protein
MPNRKTLFVLIVCFGIVTSVYLLTKNSKNIPTLIKNTVGVSTNPYINLDKNANSDWKKILVDIDPNKNVTTILAGSNSNGSDETTLTAQMSRDFLSQYLLAVKNGNLTSEEVNKIAENTLAMSDYTVIAGAKYIAANLHTTTKSDSYTLQTYKTAVNQILKDNSSQIKENPISIFQDALYSASETKMAKLDPIILINKRFIADFLALETPQKAVGVHLALLNASSAVLADLEAMRVIFTDPIRSLAAVNQYNKDMVTLKTAVENIGVFFFKN